MPVTTHALYFRCKKDTMILVLCVSQNTGSFLFRRLGVELAMVARSLALVRKYLTVSYALLPLLARPFLAPSLKYRPALFEK